MVDNSKAGAIKDLRFHFESCGLPYPTEFSVWDSLTDAERADPANDHLKNDFLNKLKEIALLWCEPEGTS